MKKILCLILPLIILGCSRKPLYLIEDAKIGINVVANLDISNYWDTAWRDSLFYEWSEEKHGKLGYSFPPRVDAIFIEGTREVERKELETGKRSFVGISLEKKYDLILYTRTKNIDERDYDIFSIQTMGWEESGIGENYKTYFQPGEIFWEGIEDVYLSTDYSDYDTVVENGKRIYVYNIDVVIRPISYIYIIQFIFIPDGDESLEIETIDGFTISGVSVQKSLISSYPKYTGLNQIFSENINPAQHISEGLIFSSRVTVLDISPSQGSGSSWVEDSDSYMYFSNLKIKTKTFGVVRGTVDITKQILHNPKGGVITVRLKESDIIRSAGTGGNFGIDVGDWENHIIDIDL